MIEKNRTGLATTTENAVLVGIVLPDQTEELVNEHLEELEFLAETAGAKTLNRFVQKRDKPFNRYFIGSGKVEEIKDYIDGHDVDLVIFDDDLSPSQTANLEKALKRKIIDRSYLILDIFAKRAKTAQARTQVDLAQMQYLLPRLRGLWTHLERQKGGIGMRGPGEKEIETDRRIVRDRIKKLEDHLAKIQKQNDTQRKNRDSMVRVALVGYTNVGKSTLMNLLSKSDVYMEDKLFATLDTTVRKMVIERMPFLLSDTVGFIRKLPHHLVESFTSTLDEAKESDVIVHVVDVSHPQYQDQIETVQSTLDELGIQDKPCIMVFNKMDLFRERTYDDLLDEETKRMIEEELEESLKELYPESEMVFISAKSKENIDGLRDTMKNVIEKTYQVRYPYVTKYW